MDYNIITGTGVNAPVLTLNGKIAITHFQGKTRQLFETEEGSFVYKQDEQELHKLTLDSYTALLIKLNTAVENMEYELTHKARL